MAPADGKKPVGLPRRGPLNRGGPGRAVPESALVLVRSFGRGRLKAASPRLQVKPFEADRDRRAAALARARAKAAGRVVGGGPGADALSGALAGALAERLVVDVRPEGWGAGPTTFDEAHVELPARVPHVDALQSCPDPAGRTLGRRPRARVRARAAGAGACRLPEGAPARAAARGRDQAVAKGRAVRARVGPAPAAAAEAVETAAQARRGRAVIPTPTPSQ